MQLLIDTDAFCKLGLGRLLKESADCLGVTWTECRRLPALGQMLRRGGLARHLGSARCAQLIPIADAMAIAPTASPAWLDRLVGIPEIDPGEAQLLAYAAETHCLVLTSDKRALRAVRLVAGFPEALRGHVVTLEALFLALCLRQGDREVRAALAPALELDTMLRVCFSSANPAPCAALTSYLADLIGEVAPLVLWEPRGEAR